MSWNDSYVKLNFGSINDISLSFSPKAIYQLPFLAIIGKTK